MSESNEALAKALAELGVSVTPEEFLKAIAEAKLEHKPVVRQPKAEAVWYRIQCGFFETVVSYTKASSIDDALIYAKSTHCEWYRIAEISDESFNGANFDVFILNHKQFNQWCEKMWPLSSTYSKTKPY